MSANLFAQISLPARVGGSVTIDGVQLTQTTATGYTFTVTRQDSSSYDPPAEDTDGVNNYNWYTINIPIYDSNNQPGGAQTGETAVIHAFLNGKELSVNSPTKGQITVGDRGSITQIDVVAQTDATTTTPTATATPTPTATPKATPTPVASPTTPPTVCGPESIYISAPVITLKRKQSRDVTVTVTGEDGCAVEDEAVTTRRTSDSQRRISVSPTSAWTDGNGQVTFRITAKKNIGNAKVTFKAGSAKKSITVRVRK